MLNDLLARNMAWTKQPDAVTRLAALQAPEFFRIGCSDNRGQANLVAPDREARRDRLAAWKVVEGARRVCETPILQRAWARDSVVRVHGLIHGPKNGRRRALDCSIGPGHFQPAHSTEEATQ